MFDIRFWILDHKKQNKALVLFAAAFCLLLSPAMAFRRDLIGTSGAQFLKLPVNARAIGLGEAYSAVADGADAIYWNPAGLGRIEGKSLSFMHAVYLKETFYDFAAYAQKIGGLGTFGLGFQYMSGNSIDRTDELGANIGTFKPYDMAISLGWARKFKGLEETEFIVGASGKFIQSQILRTAYTAASDVGIAWNPLDTLWLAFSVQNMGAAIKFKEEGDDLPLNIRVGSAYTICKSWLWSIDANFPRDNYPNVGVGTEYKKMLGSDLWFAPRAGFNSRTVADIAQLSSISAGAGFGWGGYGIDFAWVPFGSLGNSYRVSLSAKF